MLAQGLARSQILLILAPGLNCLAEQRLQKTGIDTSMVEAELAKVKDELEGAFKCQRELEGKASVVVLYRFKREL